MNPNRIQDQNKFKDWEVGKDYDLIKDLGEIATHVFHFLSMILGSFIFYKHKK